MKTDGKFDYRVVDIPAKYNKDIHIIFLGDEHFNSPNFAYKKFMADMEDISLLVKREEVYFVKTGDTFEALSTSERQHFSYGFHESNETRWEKEYAKEVGDFVKHVPFLKNKTLAVYGGNHFFKFYNGTTSDMALASALSAPYIGCSGYIILNLKFDKHHSQTVKIVCHHGRSSGRRAGSTFNSLEDMASYFKDADIIVSGHDHKAGAMQLPSIECRSGKGGHYKIQEVNRIIGRSGSYLKSYEPGVASYAVDAMMRPSTLGYLHVIVTPRRKCYSNKGIDDRWIQLKAMV
jgi:hypothetical protein